MKKITVILLMMLLTLGMSMTAVYGAADSHGTDAHSPSMSVQSGDNPIPDFGTTQEAGGGVVDDYAEAGDEDADGEFGKDDMERLVVTAVPLELTLDEELLQETGGPDLYHLAAGGAGLIVVIAIVTGLIKAAGKKKKENRYSGKH